MESLSGGELLFCAHHAREHGDTLKAVAANVIDESHRLGDSPSPPGCRLRSTPPTDRPTAPDLVSGAVGLSVGWRP